MSKIKFMAGILICLSIIGCQKEEKNDDDNINSIITKPIKKPNTGGGGGGIIINPWPDTVYYGEFEL